MNIDGREVTEAGRQFLDQRSYDMVALAADNRTFEALNVLAQEIDEALSHGGGKPLTPAKGVIERSDVRDFMSAATQNCCG